MRNILKNCTNTLSTSLLSQQQILNLSQSFILKMIPSTIRPHVKIRRYVLVSPYKNAGDLANCFPFAQRLHVKVSCVSQFVPSLYLNNVLKSFSEKCRSTSSAYKSTTPNKKRKGTGGLHCQQHTMKGIVYGIVAERFSPQLYPLQ